MSTVVAMVAGSLSTMVFVASALPMLHKAHRTRDLSSYSLGNLTLATAGNLVHWVYVASLPIGPIWFMHGFWTVASALMLWWYLRRPARPLVPGDPASAGGPLRYEGAVRG